MLDEISLQRNFKSFAIINGSTEIKGVAKIIIKGQHTISIVD
jgi:hypothetical protein